MIDSNTLDFFKWKLLHEKPTTYVKRGETNYLYCGDQKIDITDTEPDAEPSPAVERLAKRDIKPFKPVGDVTMRGVLVVRVVPDTEYYTVAFVEEGHPKKRHIVMLRVASYEQELAQERSE